MKMKIIAYLLAFAISISFTSAWSDYTHQWICDEAGLSQYDCAIADDLSYQKKINVSNNGHLCVNDTIDCRARVLAKRFFFTRPELSLHLWADSRTPVHWHNFGFEGCHREFEDCVNSNLRFGNTDWKCSIECTDLTTRQKFVNSADHQYMLSVVNYVKEQYDINKRREMAYKIAIAAISVLAVLYASFYRRK